MKKSALHTQIQATQRFNPYILKNYLTTAQDGEVIVDTDLLIKSENDARLFYVILNKDYGWDYGSHNNATIYFEVVDGKIYGGVYCKGKGRMSRSIVAVERSIAHNYSYTTYAYSSKVLLEIIDAINR